MDCGADGKLDGGVERNSQRGEIGYRVEIASKGVRHRPLDSLTGIGLDGIGEFVVGGGTDCFDEPLHGRIRLFGIEVGDQRRGVL